MITSLFFRVAVVANLLVGVAVAQPAETISLAKEVPAPPADRLKDAFPEVTDVVWHKIQKGEEVQWESTFAHEKAVYNLRYNETGTLLWSDKKVDWDSLPVEVQSAIKQALTEKLGKHTVLLTEERVAGRLQQYALTVATKTPKGSQRYTAIFDRAGVLNRIETGQLVPQRPGKSRK